MDNNRYFFDKRSWKRRMIKYGVTFLVAFFPVVLFNIYIGDLIKHNWIVILLDCVIILLFVLAGNWVFNRIYEAKDARLERLRLAREEAEARKKQIMEDSYKRKREEKTASKNKKSNSNIKQEVEAVDTSSSDTEDTTKVVSRPSKQKQKKVKVKPTIIKQTKED